MSSLSNQTQLTADSAVERLVQSMIEQCLLHNASDLHLEPNAEGYRVRMRQLGELRVAEHLNARLAPRVVAHIKILAQLDITERRLPQDGRCGFQVRGKRIDCRVNTLPTLWGEKVVLRLLGLGESQTCMGTAGLLPPQQALLKRCLTQREGLILTTGPTGSGKTQTLYTLLHSINTEQRNISTVEDPIEVDLDGVNQINVQPTLGFTFAQALRALMRQDPDVIMVGEIRDAETASMACQAAQTGHLVLATLHASSPISALIRLQQLGIDGYQLAASLLLLMNQRLITVVASGQSEHRLEPRPARRIGAFELVPMQERLRMALLANPNHAHYWRDVDEACASELNIDQAKLYHQQAITPLAAAEPSPQRLYGEELSHV